jgi:hypothetical protein
VQQQGMVCMKDLTGLVRKLIIDFKIDRINYRIILFCSSILQRQFGIWSLTKLSHIVTSKS